jgi:hypothetical protein
LQVLNYTPNIEPQIRADQQSLKYIHEQRLIDGIQHKLLIKLLGFNYVVEYKKGKENKVADALCRASHAQSLAISCVVPVWIEQFLGNQYFIGTRCIGRLRSMLSHVLYARKTNHYDSKY